MSTINSNLILGRVNPADNLSPTIDPSKLPTQMAKVVSAPEKAPLVIGDFLSSLKKRRFVGVDDGRQVLLGEHKDTGHLYLIRPSPDGKGINFEEIPYPEFGYMSPEKAEFTRISPEKAAKFRSIWYEEIKGKIREDIIGNKYTGFLYGRNGTMVPAQIKK